MGRAEPDVRLTHWRNERCLIIDHAITNFLKREWYICLWTDEFRKGTAYKLSVDSFMSSFFSFRKVLIIFALFVFSVFSFAVSTCISFCYTSFIIICMRHWVKTKKFATYSEKSITFRLICIWRHRILTTHEMAPPIFHDLMGYDNF